MLVDFYNYHFRYSDKVHLLVLFKVLFVIMSCLAKFFKVCLCWGAPKMFYLIFIYDVYKNVYIMFCRHWHNNLTCSTKTDISIPCLIFVGKSAIHRNLILFSFIFSQFNAELQPLPVSGKVLHLSCMLIISVWGETDLKCVSNAIKHFKDVDLIS